MSLAIVTILLLIALKVLPGCFQPDPLVVVQKAVVPQSERADEAKEEREPGKKETAHASQLFLFNPNSLPVESWMRLGLSRKQAESVHRYEAAGGSFRVKRDVLKLFVVDEDDYHRWEAFIDLPDEWREIAAEKGEALPVKEQADVRIEIPEVLPDKVDLNDADTVALQSVRGIGAYTARQIVWYRQNLGGFISMEQLREVKGIRPGNLTSILSQVELSPAVSHPLAVNLLDASGLGRHPYLSWDQARAIENYRKQHGPFASADDLLHIHLIQESDLHRLDPYLDFNTTLDSIPKP